MKTGYSNYVIAILVSLTLISFRTIKPENGPHGGSVQKANNYNIETKITYPSLFAFLLSADRKPLHNKNMNCEVRFFSPDSSYIDLPLKRFGEDGFTINSIPEVFSAYRIIFNVEGKQVSTIFSNEVVFAQGKE